MFGGREKKYRVLSCLFLFPAVCFNNCWRSAIYPLAGIAGPALSFSPNGSLEPAAKQIPQHTSVLRQDNCHNKQALREGLGIEWGIILMSLPLAKTIHRPHVVQITQKQYLVVIPKSS